MKLFPFLLFITGLVNLALGEVVFFKNRKRLPNRIFPLFALNLAIWSFVVMGIVLAPSLEKAKFFVRLAFFVGAFLPANFFFFVSTFGDKKIKDESRKIKSFYSLSFFTAILCFLPSFIQKAEYPSPGIVVYLPGPEVVYSKQIFIFYIGVVLSIMGYSLAYLFKKSKRVSGIQRQEIYYIFLGVLAGTIFTALTILLPPLFGVTILSRFASFSSILMVGIISYAIAKYRIMDISLVYEFTLLYASLSFILLIIYLGSIAFLTKILKVFEPTSKLSLLPYLLGAFFVALFFTPIKEKIQYILKKKIFRDRYKREEFFQKVVNILSSLKFPPEIFNDLSELLYHNLGVPKKILLLIKRGALEGISEFSSITFNLNIIDNSYIFDYFEEKKGIIISEEIGRFSFRDEIFQKIITELNKTGYDVAVPVIVKEKSIGALLLKNKISCGIFNNMDILMLENLGIHLGIILENLSLYNRLSKANIYQESLLKNSPYGVISVNSEGKIVIFNNEAEALIGLESKKVLGKEYSILPEEIMNIIENNLKNKKDIKGVELNLKNIQNGKTKIVNFHISSFYDKEGNFLGTQVIFFDVTHIRKLEEEMKRAEKLASLGVMAAGLAHEIKNPLVSIKAFAQLLPKRYQDEEFRNTFSDLIVREIDRINNLIEQVLTFSKLKIPKFNKVDVVKIIKSALVLFSAQSKKKNLKIFEDYFADKIIIEGNDEKLQQAFLNILINAGDAIKDKDEGIIKINVFDQEEDVRIEIEDNGCGIKREILDKIYDPFFTTKEKGTGLGLSIVSKIIEEHKGKLRVESEENVGTKVIIILKKKMKERTNELHYSNK